MAFNAEIGNYAGETDAYPNAISKFLANGVQWVISMLEKTNPDMLPLFASLQTLNNSSPTLTLATNAKIIDVVRTSADSSGEDLKCSPINSAFRSNAANSDSLYYASVNSPVYYINNAVLTVLPTPTASQTAKISMVLPDTSVAGTDSAIDNFPSEMYHAVVLYAAVQLLHHKMASLNAKLPTDLDADTTVFDALADYSSTLNVSSSLPSAINMGSTALPSAISVSADLPSAISITKSLPSGISITKGLPSDFTIASSLPTAIDMNSISPPSDFSFTQNVPSLTISTTLDSEHGDAIGKVKDLISVGIATDEASGSGDDATAQSAGYWLADEDEEMAQATIQTAAQELQRASGWLAEFQAGISKEVQQFDATVTKYTSEIQKETSRIQADSQRHSDQLQKEMQRVANEAQIYSNEIQKETSRIQSEIAEYSAEIQKESSRTGTDVSIYQAELQKESARVQNEATIFTTELGLRTSQMQQQVSAYTNLLGKETARVQNEATIYTTELQKESMRLQDDLSEYTTNLQKKISLYTTIISKLTTDYQWLQSQYQVVKQELSEFMTPYTQAGILDSTAEGVRR